MDIAYASVINNQLRSKVVGKQIKNVIANQNPHKFVWFATEPAQAWQYNHNAAPEMEKYIIYKSIEKCSVHNGAQNCLYLGGQVFMSDIAPRFYNSGEKQPKKHQLMLEFEDGGYLTYTASLGGILNLFRLNEEGLPINNSSFPMILSDDFSFDYFYRLILKTELNSISVKQFLATKNRIPGLDNSLLQDILWDAQINPKSKMKVLKEEEYQQIFNSIKTVTNEIILHGGKDTDKDIYGDYGRYITRASRNTQGKPCKRCGTAIEKEAYLGGSVYYCPACQPIKLK